MMMREACLDDAPAIAQVHVHTWGTAYGGIMPADYLAALSYRKWERRWRQMLRTKAENQHFVYVVEDGAGQIIAFADGGPERRGDPVYKGELYAIYVLDAHQRQGIGRQLTFSIVERLADIGLQSLLVWALADNPARRFYEVLGGQKVYEKQLARGGVKLKEIAYGWTDTRVLLAGHPGEALTWKGANLIIDS